MELCPFNLQPPGEKVIRQVKLVEQDIHKVQGDIGDLLNSVREQVGRLPAYGASVHDVDAYNVDSPQKGSADEAKEESKQKRV